MKSRIGVTSIMIVAGNEAIFTTRNICIACSSLVLSITFLGLFVSAEEDVVSNRNASERHFAREVWPVLAEKCQACHGKDRDNIRGGFDLATSASALKGGESGEAAIVPGQPERSPLFLSVTRSHADWSAMPPKDNDALTPSQIEALRRWISDGAIWIEGAALARHASPSIAEGEVQVRTSPALHPAWETRAYATEDLWAYRPLQKVATPGASQNPIDAFLNSRMEAESVSPAKRADARSLIRRATMDLTGLLPAFEEVERFVADEGTDTWPALIDRLLDSSQYGAQMARRWLDVVRYADSAGFSNDLDLANAWRYRDYVIRSFNRDTPFDRFVLEQIAGDELPDANAETLLATGFLRMGPWEHLGMAVAAETRQQWLDDVVNSVGNTFLGLEMSCFKCHDHKFDPLPTRDYYAMQAVFATTQPADIKLAFLQEENTTAFDSRKAEAGTLAERFSKKKKKAEKGRFAGFNRTTIQRRVERWAKAYEPVALGVFNGPTRTMESTALYSYPPNAEAGVTLMKVNILRGGSLGAPGDEVGPATLSAVADLSAWTADPFPEGADGRRLALAKWLVDHRNPFTARVIVNRVWEWHFGNQPLVATPNSFGVKGAKPTHPELLDWLAVWFMDHGWSLKKLHRLIMTSDAYQRSLTLPAGVQADRATELLASFPARRLTAEELRDALLQASGEINLALGGIPARPQMHWDAAQMAVNVQSGIDLPYRPDRTAAERNKRTVMTHHQRSRRDPLLEVFDQPASERSCERRGETIVVPQVLALMNGDFSHDRAIAMADLLMKSTATMPERVTAAYHRLLGRAPTMHERQQCEIFVSQQTRHHETHPVTRVDVRRLVELASAYDPDYAKTYESDLQAVDVTEETRALADLCLTLFNTSEFLYVP